MMAALQNLQGLSIRCDCYYL